MVWGFCQLRSGTKWLRAQVKEDTQVGARRPSQEVFHQTRPGPWARPLDGSQVDSRKSVRQHGEPMNPFRDRLRESRAVVFVNPLAGAGRAQKYVPRVRQIFEAEKISAEFILTESARELESRAKSAIAGACRFLVAMGGDGTLQGLVNAAIGSEVLLGVLPAGGGNDFSMALGLPNHPVAAARVLLNGQPRSVDLLRARTFDSRERLYVGGGGVGLDVDASRYAAGRYRRISGRMRYVISAVRAWREFAPLHVCAEFPGGEHPDIEGRVLLAGVLNAPSYGAGLRVAPEARLDDGWLNVTLVKTLSALQVFALVPRLLINGTLPATYLQQKRARKVLLRTDRPCLFHGDGEILGPAPVEIEVVPGAVKVLAPPVCRDPAR